MKVNNVSLPLSTGFCKSNNSSGGQNKKTSFGINPYTDKSSYLSNQVSTYVQTAVSPKKSYTAKQITGMILGTAIVGITAFTALKNVKKTSSVLGNLPQADIYRETLARALSEYSGKKVEPQRLSCVVNKEEFTGLISNLKRENYVCTKENMEKGIFRADLHSHSNFSDGKGKVEELLDAAAKYGDNLFAKTKNKFIFALTDHDGVEGVKKALTIISKNPEKFENVRFVAGAELSYALKSPKSKNPTETSEVLAYCINPFDKKTTAYFENLYEKRRNAVSETIDDLNKMFPYVKFSTEEFGKSYGADINSAMYQMNLHWKLHHYGQTKLAISDIARQNGQDANALYSDIMSKTKRGKALGNLKDEKLISPYINENSEIIALRKKIQPKITSDNLVNTQTESTIEELTNTFAEDKETVFAVAHPYYLTERVENPAEFVKSIKDKFNGKLIGTESYHQAYSDRISKTEIEKVNSEIEKLGLISLGGRDNHKPALL